MNSTFKLIRPRFSPPLDPEFRPAVLANRIFRQSILDTNTGMPLVLALERMDGHVSRYELSVFSDEHKLAESNLIFAERIFKTLLWQRGGWKIYIGGSARIGDYIKNIYSPGKERAFDNRFMGDILYGKPFTIILCPVGDVPDASESREELGRHLDGCRIGFDLGASDLKVSAVVDGTAVFSEEVEWQPGVQENPMYHYKKIMAALKKAATKMDRVDAIGGSAAGVYVGNRVRVSSLFRGVPEERYDEVRNLFIRIQGEMGVPLEIVNDGDVTALAGSMALEDTGILGIALGSSEAAGYVTREGNLTGWLNELAFVPIDYNPHAPIDEWSGDRGCGAQYFSQQCVFRLAPKVGIHIPDALSPAEKLKYVQNKLESGHSGAIDIWRTMGVYMGYAIAHYADFYDIKNVLILGRCTSGRGGLMILEEAGKILKLEFPELAEHMKIRLPDEKSRRVGQAIAAASLPVLAKEG